MRGDPSDCVQTLHAPLPPPAPPNFCPILPHFPPLSPTFPHLSSGHRPVIPTRCVPSALKTTICHRLGYGLSPFSHAVLQQQHVFTHFPPFPHIFPVSEQCSGNVEAVAISGPWHHVTFISHPYHIHSYARSKGKASPPPPSATTTRLPLSPTACPSPPITEWLSSQR